MNPRYAPCPRCQRHVCGIDPRCPFCGAAQPTARLYGPEVRGRLSRAALLAACVAAGCSSTTGGADAAVDASAAPGPDTARPPEDTSVADSAPADTARDTGSADTARDVFPTDTGSIEAMYGVPPPPRDSGADTSDTSNFLLYGAPPPPEPPGDAG
ncbi:MAG: hypothetical protein HY909_06545 [Deltaproteobacteria bacterium]|nr:hypothetical protein [Deltaproteobacteria bacterium]